MTLLGPLPCRGCRETVSVVRRPVVIACWAHTHGGKACRARSRELSEVVPVDADGARHLCRMTVAA